MLVNEHQADVDPLGNSISSSKDPQLSKVDEMRVLFLDPAFELNSIYFANDIDEEKRVHDFFVIGTPFYKIAKIAACTKQWSTLP